MFCDIYYICFVILVYNCNCIAISVRGFGGRYIGTSVISERANDRRQSAFTIPPLQKFSSKIRTDAARIAL